jgi:hypothetical protein
MIAATIAWRKVRQLVCTVFDHTWIKHSKKVVRCQVCDKKWRNKRRSS